MREREGEREGEGRERERERERIYSRIDTPHIFYTAIRCWI